MWDDDDDEWEEVDDDFELDDDWFDDEEEEETTSPYQDTAVMWDNIGRELTKIESQNGWFTASSIKVEIENQKRNFIDIHQGRRPIEDSDYFGTMQHIFSRTDIVPGDKLRCIYSNNRTFSKDTVYEFAGTECQHPSFETDNGHDMWRGADWMPRYTKTFFQFIPKGYDEEGIRLPIEHGELNNFELPDLRGSYIKESTMCLSKQAINKLNGLKKGEEHLVELVQDSSEDKKVSLDLGKILGKSDKVSGFELGKGALLKSVDLRGDKLELKLSVGEVEREETQVVLANLQKSILAQSEE